MQLAGAVVGEAVPWRLGYRPGLDGLRGIAVLMVVATHFDEGQVTLAGVMGVKIFFALSGFLISSLILQEFADAGRVAWRRFYARRAVRLFPALALMVSIIGVGTLRGWPTDVSGPMVASVAGYVSNWYLLATATHGAVRWGALGHTWSLAIEEQFYLVWPWALLAAARWGRRWALTLTMGGAVASLVWGLASGRSALATDVSAWCLLSGCALAVALHGRCVPGRTRVWMPALSVAALLALSFGSGAAADGTAHVLAPLAAVNLIWSAATGRVPWLESSWLQWCGRRSYGIYLWHVPIAYLCLHVTEPWPWPVIAGLGVATSFALAELSWRLVESPLLRRHRAAPAPSTVSALAA